MTERRWKQALVCWMILVGLFGVDAVKADGSCRVPRPGAGRGEGLCAGWRDRAVQQRPGMQMEHCGRTPQTHIRQEPGGRRRVAAGERVFSTAPGGWADPEGIRPQDPCGSRDLDSLRWTGNAGKQVHVVLATPDDNLAIQWRVELRDGSNYVRQYVSLTAEESRRGLAGDRPRAIEGTACEGRRHTGRLARHGRRHVLLRLRAPAIQDPNARFGDFNAACREAHR